MSDNTKQSSPIDFNEDGKVSIKEFIIDKFVDFVLIFVGLYAALAVENSIAETENKNNYINDLLKVHEEILRNNNETENIKSYIEFHSNRANDIADYFINGKKVMHVIQTINDISFEFNSFNSIDKDNFKNREILSKVFELYDQYNKTNTLFVDYIDNSDNLSKFHLMKDKYNTRLTNEDFSELNYGIDKASAIKESNLKNANKCLELTSQLSQLISDELTSLGTSIPMDNIN
tara:strand:+ start:441 stop:1139 length:699 start_codon:yes stop_codon:yes gene_type:complete